ncbi:MAG: c-type cytochrome [Planctomycetes bacterium]|nr:c-type cytochrome [Planctomycetota bacterium]
MARRPEPLLAALLLLLLGCPGAPGGPPAAPPAAPPLLPPGAIAQPLPRLPDEGPVYAIDPLPARTPALVPGAGRDALVAHCSTCHSTAYVTLQPPLPEAGWRATLEKMQRTYGAEVPDAAAEQVLAYLAAHYTPETIDAAYVALQGAPAPDDAGARVYRTACAPCHQPDGKGLPGAFPPLVGHAATLAADRREHLVRLALFGQQGPIEAAGQRFDAAMPGASHLSDEELAAVLNYVTRAWGNDARLPADAAPFRPDEVGRARGMSMTPREVHALRGP